MSDLVVKTRVAVAIRNLHRIRDLGNTVTRSEAGLGDFLSLPTELRDTVVKLLEEVRQMKTKATPFEDQAPELIDRLTQVETELSSTMRDLRERAQQAERLRSQLLTLPGDRKDVTDYLVEKARELQETLTEENYWKQRERCDGLFSEYVDLLRGMTLRNAGFTDDDVRISDLFRIADRLPSLWRRIEGWEWHSLVVPSRQERNASTDAMVLRIGFPEWTIWALPLLQHEFGHIFVKRKRLVSVGARQSSQATLLADALATLVTGSAYACAALLVRLDPGACTSESSIVALRSATILATLHKSTEEGQPLEMLATRLKNEWRDAVRSASGDPTPLDGLIKSSFIADVVDRAQEAILGVGPIGISKRPHWADRWATVANWARLLNEKKPDEINLADANVENDDRPLALALLLDAAWLARVGITADQDAEDIDTVASGAVKLLLKAIGPPVGRTIRQPNVAGRTGE